MSRNVPLLTLGRQIVGTPHFSSQTAPRLPSQKSKRWKVVKIEVSNNEGTDTFSGHAEQASATAGAALSAASPLRVDLAWVSPRRSPISHTYGKLADHPTSVSLSIAILAIFAEEEQPGEATYTPMPRP
jgi:hypothetical protein